MIRVQKLKENSPVLKIRIPDIYEIWAFFRNYTAH